MPRINNRDDFSSETISITAKRVCYQCSICSCLTTAASEEGKRKVLNIGVASHICAAAPKGPRYDPLMTPEQRKNVDNCIWLCQTHSRMIDQDTVKYTVEKLKQIKKEAEERVNIALTNGVSFSKKLAKEGLPIEKMYEVLNTLLINGDFLKLKVYLESINTDTISLQLLDVHDYFQIVYKFYCDRRDIENLIVKYLEREIKNYVNNLVELFAQFFDKHLLKLVIDYCQDAKLKKICEFILNDDLEGKLFVKVKKDEKLSIDVDKIVNDSFTHKLSTSYALEHMCKLQDANGEIKYYSGDYYYQQKINILNLYNNGIELVYVKKQKIADIVEYKKFEKEIHKIKQLAPELQLFFWRNVLALANHLHDIDAFNSLYLECSDYIRNDVQIKKNYYLSKIETDILNVDIEEIKTMCTISGDYKLANAYLCELLYVDDKKVEIIFNENQFLLSKNSYFLDIYIRMKLKRKTKNFSCVTFLLRYKELYKNDFCFNVLLTYYSSKNKKYKSQYKKALNFIKTQEINSDLEGFCLNYLIIIYNYTKDFFKLKELNELNPITNFKLQIANCLQNSEDREDLLYAKNIYENVISEKPGLACVNSYLSNVDYKLRLFDESKQAIKKELDINFNYYDLKRLLQLKIETLDYEIDNFVITAEQSKDDELLMLTGIIYSNGEDTKQKAFNCFLKSLLINDNNHNSLSGLLTLSYDFDKKKKPLKVEPGVFVILKNDQQEIRIAVHKNNLIEGFVPKRFANILHFKESDKYIENLLYSTINDEVEFKNEKFYVKSLESIENILFAYAMKYMTMAPNTVTFSGPIEESKKQMIEYLEGVKKHNDEIVRLYNESECRLPISILSNRLGKKILECYDFLYYENDHRIKNLNTTKIEYNNEGYILSFDIIYALAILNIDVDIIKNLNCYCSLMTKRIMLNEVEEFVKNLKSSSYGGSLYTKDGKLYRTDTSENFKNSQLKFFNRLKRILDVLKTPTRVYSYKGHKEIENLIYENKLSLEDDTLGYVQQQDNFIFVNDDTFISAIIMLEKIKAIGLNALLTKLGLDFEKLIECIKQLSVMNYGNYITPDIYTLIKAIILSAKEKQRDYLNEFYKLLTATHLEENSKSWKYNNLILRTIIKENNISVDSDDLVENCVLKASVHNYSKEFPKEYQETIDDIRRRFRVRLVEKDNRVYLETFLVEDKKED